LSASVDVLIAARDCAGTIERAVRSALEQAEVRAVIVVDDGSIDDTAKRAESCDPTGSRVILERLCVSGGPSAARNIGIERSTAPWLAVLDADDFFVPERIGALLSQSAGSDFVADDLLHIRGDRLDHQGCVASLHSAQSERRRLTFEQFVLGNLTRRGAHRKELGYLKPLMYREFLVRHALRYDESLRFGEDYVLYARALAEGARFFIIPRAGYVAVERAASLSSRHTRRDLEALREKDLELMAMSHLTSIERDAVARHCADLDRRTQWLVLVDALQSRNIPKVLYTFFGSPALTLYLIVRLITEAPLQIRKRLKLLTHR
jgi:succinoglycan biosynthesis protein ExoU